jgi:hypothetical protein
VARRGVLSFAKRRRGPHGGIAGPGRSPVGLRIQPPNEEFFTLSSEARSNIVERVAIPLAAHHGAEASP